MSSNKKTRYVLDTSVLSAIVNSSEPEHFSCYSFFRNLHDDDLAIWVVPGLIFFEFQATQSRRNRDQGKQKAAYRYAPLFETNCELYHITKPFLNKVWDRNLYDKFEHLKGADLVYACIAQIEEIALVTHDNDFDKYKSDITIIKPRELYPDSLLK